ncbi:MULTISPECIES: N-6 DNA methylase [Croceimicrobium]|uniref:site-specific DNA-methyltransferase (adenine-specific) n=1 Tax=Croceimicrobium hydrocarbonivorans TaxID=2761580 RepID=A0A7H0VBV3_9FLAO|nr:N-6 DNA methylase [Croceimicrobium hydrocarbonivorans]QNR23201.1 class I SAM-dependent methyltransferase [Croceimicrobium hydrocarbonivorans]
MGQIKKNISAQKLRGGYYTPQAIADFLCQWSIDKKTERILEPSCGDGNFIESAILRFKELGIEGEDLKGRIKGIELLKEESLKAKARAANLGLNSNTIVNHDFFHYISSNVVEKYDVVIGNPPFIRYQSFPEEHRKLAIGMMQDLGLSPNKLTNIWVPFLVVSASLLKDDGRIAMVVPAELFQVKYAAETRVFLSKFFERITIITFKKLVFASIQQEVVLLLCEKKVYHGKGVRVIECENLDELKSINFKAINGSNVKPIDHTTEKWTKYFLNEGEINLLRGLRKDKRVTTCGDIMEVDVGLVTGRNEFFMMNEEQVKAWKLKKYTIPVASKSNQLKGITFSETDFSNNSKAQNAIHLFIPPNEDFEKLPKVCQNYIEYGEQQGFHTGYKTRIRRRWYITPSLWVPDAFALRQVGDYPKLILNETGASSTDTIHRVRFKEGVNRSMAAISFLNSLSFAFSEITGRSYGGGVMTFEPTEIEEIQIPVLADLDIDFDQVDSLIRQRKIEEALDIMDEAFLIKHHGFKKSEVDDLRAVWKKLSQRRNNRKR